MSTSEIYLSEEQIAHFIEETKSEPQFFYGYEGQEYGVCPFITFYVYHQDEDFLPLCEKMIDIHRALENMIDSPYQMIWKDSTQTWFKAGSKRLPQDLAAEVAIAHKKGKEFWIRATDMESPAASACWAIDAEVVTNSSMRYTTLKITFRHSWYLNNQARWHAFVLDCLKRLEPEQCYSGFEIGTTASGVMGAYESDVMERICADYFYGLDIDHPGDMGFQYHRDEDGWVNTTRLGVGLRAPTWCFLLSPIWLGKLGLDEAGVRKALGDPRIQITTLPRSDGGANLWVQLGELSLYPVDEGVPELPVLANKLIRPVRCDDLRLISLDPWDDDPNPRFNFDSETRWMRRFDEDSDWPSPEKRHPAKLGTAQSGVPDSLAPRLRAFPGERCPKTGSWYALHLGGKVVRVNEGDPMPGPEYGATGTVIWYFKDE